MVLRMVGSLRMLRGGDERDDGDDLAECLCLYGDGVVMRLRLS